MNEINKINPNIKLTMIHTSVPGEEDPDKCDCRPVNSTPFLDTLCSIKDRQIQTDLYRKPTDRNQYLLPDSCHPKQTTLAIPRGLSVKIIKICSDPALRDKRLSQLKERLLERGYKKEMVESAINRAIKIPREAVLRKVEKKGKK